MAALPRIAILLPSRNDESFIATTLLSIFREAAEYQAAGGALAIAVVNDASTDRTATVVDGMRPLSPVPFTFINRTESRGTAWALNEAFVAVAGGSELVLRADADARFIQSGWLRRMVAFLTSDPRIGIVAPLSVFPDGTIDTHGVNYLPNGRALVLHDREYGAQPIEPIAEVDAVLGVYALLRTADWEIDTVYSMWREDEDQCLALRRRGRKCFSMASIEVVHYHRLRWARVSDRVTIEAWRRRHHPPRRQPQPTRLSELRAAAELLAAGTLPAFAKRGLRRFIPAAPAHAAPPAAQPPRLEAAWRQNSQHFANKWGFPRTDPWTYVQPDQRAWTQEEQDALAGSRAARLLRRRYSVEGLEEGREIIRRFQCSGV